MDTQHSVVIEIISRGNNRKGSWSTKRVRKAIQDLGYSVNGINPSKPDNQLIQVVVIKGSRGMIDKARTDIARKLKGLAGCRVPTKFTLVK